MKENHYCSYSHFSFHMCWGATITNWLMMSNNFSTALVLLGWTFSCPPPLTGAQLQHFLHERLICSEPRAHWGVWQTKVAGFSHMRGDMLITMHRTGINFRLQSSMKHMDTKHTCQLQFEIFTQPQTQMHRTAGFIILLSHLVALWSFWGN